MQITTVTGYVSVQIENYGKTSEDRIESLKETFTPSANALRKALGMIATKEKAESSGDGGEQKKSIKTTKTYHFEMSADKAIAALNSIDSKGNTEAFDRHLSEYQVVASSIGNPTELPLEQRLEAYKRLNQCGFYSYSFQVSIQVPGSYADDKYIRSKKHHQMQSWSEEAIKALIGPFCSKWIGEKTSSTSEDEGDSDDQTPGLGNPNS